MRVFIDTNLWAYRLDRQDPKNQIKRAAGSPMWLPITR